MALGAIVCLVLAVSAAQAGRITLGTPVTTSDGGLDVSVNMTPDTGQDVAALQFDLHYDSSRYGFADAASGDAATGAGKDAAVSETELGMVRVVVAGINQDTLGAGTVATLHFDRLDKTVSSPSFSDNATLDEVVASGPSGENIGGLDVSAAVSESTPATATESNGKTTSTGTSASAQNNVGKVTAGIGVTGVDPALESGLGSPGVSSQRNTASMGASVGSRASAQGAVQAVTPVIPQGSGTVPPRQASENPFLGNPVKMAKNPVSGSGRVYEQSQKAVTAAQHAEETALAGRSPQVSHVGHSNGKSERTLLAGTGAVSPPLPAVAASKTADCALKTNDSSNSGMVVLLAGSGAVLMVVLGAWAFRRR